MRTHSTGVQIVNPFIFLGGDRFVTPDSFVTPCRQTLAATQDVTVE